MPPTTYRITTLGCRVNHAETREIESILLGRGLTRAAADVQADLEIIHTCSVTNRAAAKSRHAVRQAVRRISTVSASRNSSGSSQAQDQGCDLRATCWTPQVVVTGCYAETHNNEASELIGSGKRVMPHESANGTSMLERLADRVDSWLDDRNMQLSPIRTLPSGSSTGHIHCLPVIRPESGAGTHTRAELRIQDGCDAHCTFCIIPRIRRTLRSKTIPDAVDEAKRLVDLGHKEIVLSGVFIGAYGRNTALRRNQDGHSTDSLADLLHAVAQVPGLQRLRLSSMEPGDVTEPLLDAMITNQNVVVPHLHLPLQSGSDRVLKMMNRQYRIGDYLEMIRQVNEALTCLGSGRADSALTTPPLPPALTTDIICGFPGETDEDFQETLAVAHSVGYLHMHVFPFSPKEGTAAARWKDRFVDQATKKARVHSLRDVENNPNEGLSIKFRRRLLGRTVRVILEQPDKENRGLMTGRCDHYALIHVRTDHPRGTLIDVRITDVVPDHTFGEVAPITSSLPVL